MSNLVYLSLGSNMGERIDYLKKAIKLLDTHPKINIEKVSSIYETAPVGYTNQSSFLNMVAGISTVLSPMELLDITQDIELKCHRTREIRWGPRTLDLDILLFNNENIETERLIIPHPRMFERGFVLIPLNEIDPQILNKYQIDINELPDKEGIQIWKRRTGEDVYGLFES